MNLRPAGAAASGRPANPRWRAGRPAGCRPAGRRSPPAGAVGGEHHLRVAAAVAQADGGGHPAGVVGEDLDVQVVGRQHLGGVVDPDPVLPGPLGVPADLGQPEPAGDGVGVEDVLGAFGELLHQHRLVPVSEPVGGVQQQVEVQPPVGAGRDEVDVLGAAALRRLGHQLAAGEAGVGDPPRDPGRVVRAHLPQHRDAGGQQRLRHLPLVPPRGRAARPVPSPGSNSSARLSASSTPDSMPGTTQTGR